MIVNLTSGRLLHSKKKMIFFEKLTQMQSVERLLQKIMPAELENAIHSLTDKNFFFLIFSDFTRKIPAEFDCLLMGFTIKLLSYIIDSLEKFRSKRKLLQKSSDSRRKYTKFFSMHATEIIVNAHFVVISPIFAILLAIFTVIY